MKNHLVYLLLLTVLSFSGLSLSGAVLAVDRAPRISDREIVERLVRLEEGQKAMQRQMDAQWNLTLAMLCAIFGLIGFVVWDRKTALKPLEERLQEVKNDLELKSSEGPRLTRLMDALRDLASEDRRLSDALQRHSLL